MNDEVSPNNRGAVDSKDVLTILTEDIQSHRDYIQQLYKNALFLLAGVFGAGIALGIWILGNRLDDSILLYQINDELQEKVKSITGEHLKKAQAKIEIATSTAIDTAKTEISDAREGATITAKSDIAEAGANAIVTAVKFVDQYLGGQLAVEIEDLFQPQLAELARKSASDLAADISLPKGIVGMFNRSGASGGSCPPGWSLFEPAGGRFIVGAGAYQNTNYSKYPSYADDPKGSTGGVETVTLTVPPKHSHSQGSLSIGLSSPFLHANPLLGSTLQTAANLGVTLNAPPGGAYTANVGSHSHSINGSTGTVGNNQPHNNMPPYIALYFCKKD